MSANFIVLDVSYTVRGHHYAEYTLATTERRKVQYAGTGQHIIFVDLAQAQEWAATWNAEGMPEDKWQLAKTKLSKVTFEAMRLTKPAQCEDCGNWLMGAECLGTVCNTCLSKRAAKRKYQERLEARNETSLGHYIHQDGQGGFAKAYRVNTSRGTVTITSYKYDLNCWLSDGITTLSYANLEAIMDAVKAALEGI